MHIEMRSFIIFVLVTVMKLRRVRWMEHAAHMREIKNAYKTFVGKPEGKIGLSLVIRLSIWEDNIKMAFKKCV
jgi:hypothetical protein